MRGDVALDFPVPRGGFRTDRPLHRLPPDVLTGGQNMMIDEDGLLKPRLGYHALSAQPTAIQLDADARVVAAVTWEAGGGQSPLVVAGLTRWMVLLAGAWSDLSGDPGGLHLNGSKTVAAKLVQFGVTQYAPNVSFTDAVYGVNGPLQDPLMVWQLGSAKYQQVTPQAAPGQAAVPQFRGTDLAVVANRLVVVGTTGDGGNDTLRRVRWSSVNDGVTWPFLAFAELTGDAGILVAIEPTSRTSAVIYGENGAWIMTAQPGDDANAFAFDRVLGVTSGPASSEAIVNVGGVHYYLSLDGHIWQCDGTYGQIISFPIDAYLSAHLSVGTAQKPVGLYDSVRHRIIWFICTDGAEEAQTAIAFNLVTRTWEVPWALADPVTMALQVTETLGPTWDNPGKDALGNDFTWDTAPWADWNHIPENDDLAVYIGTTDGRLFNFFAAANDNGIAIVYDAIWSLRAPQNATQQYVANQIDLQLSPMTGEVFTCVLDGLRTPFDPAASNLVIETVDPSNVDAWTFVLTPGVRVGAFRPANYLRFRVKGVSVSQSLALGGATVYAAAQNRPDNTPATAMPA